MKRIVQCPKCQVKLSVMDIGKPINQKCPKCGESFVVESEEAKSIDAKKEQTETVPPVAPKTDAKTDATAVPSPDAKAKGEPKSETKPDVTPESPKDTALKPAPKTAVPKPASPAPLESKFPEHQCGVSFMHIIVIIVLLVFVIVMQVRTANNSAKNFSAIEQRLDSIKAHLDKK